MTTATHNAPYNANEPVLFLAFELSENPGSTLPQSSRRSATGSSARCVGWDIWRRALMLPWPPGMIRCSTPNRSSPAPWRPRSSSAAPLGNGLERRCDGLALVLAMKGNALNSRDLAVPV